MRSRPLNALFLAGLAMAAGPRGFARAGDRVVAVTFDDLPGPPGGLWSNAIPDFRQNRRKLLATFAEHRIPVLGFSQSMKARGYAFITLEEALADEAYRSPDTYVGRWGISWLHHWELTASGKRSLPPDPPDWVAKAYDALPR